MRFWEADTFFYAFFQIHPKTRLRFIRIIIQDINQAFRITCNQIANFVIEVPPINEQMSIVRYLDNEFSKIDVAIKEITSQIDSLKLLKNTLTKELISGQLHLC